MLFDLYSLQKQLSSLGGTESDRHINSYTMDEYFLNEREKLHEQ